MAEDTKKKGPAAAEPLDADTTSARNTEGQGTKNKRNRRTDSQIAADKLNDCKNYICGLDDEKREELIAELREQGIITTAQEEKEYRNPNLDDYNRLRHMPENACRLIDEGPLKGKTNINPMARVKMLTENYGSYGIGWKMEIVKTEIVGSGDGTMVSVLVALFINKNGEWLSPSYGFGGCAFYRNGDHQYGVDDDCYKKATTDAFGVACKNFGMAADIYYENDANYETKYDSDSKKNNAPTLKDQLQKAGKPIAPQAAETPAAEQKPAEKKEKKEEKAPETAKTGTAEKEGWTDSEPKPASAAEAKTSDLSKNHRSYTAILTHICSLPDKSEANLNRIRERYRTEKGINIPDDLWKEMLGTALAA